jgi:organic radical activating enzyme
MDDSRIDRDYYCSMKFRYLKIDLESVTSYTCHAATPHPIDIKWLEHNKGNLFNHDINVLERQLMLKNQRAASCEQNCWHAEDRGMSSPRIYQKGYIRTHDQIVTKPEIVDIVVGSDCNLTCSYCCKEFSSAWRNDIKTNGEYLLPEVKDNRYKLSPKDLLLMKSKQSNMVESRQYKILIDEIQSNASALKRIDVTGGEPFLNNYLIETLSSIDVADDVRIKIYSGLGVNPTRFSRILDKISHKKNILIAISAECVEKYLEFNRYGIDWHQFQANLQSIRDRKINLRFHSTLTNLTVFGFVDFFNYFGNDDITVTFAQQPRMMAINVIDDESKWQLIKQFDALPEEHKKTLIKNLEPEAEENQRYNLSIFLSEFVRRRPDLNLNIYPQSFLKWLGIQNVV